MRGMTRPRVCIVTPALAAANNGNWHTAERWQGFLSDVADVDVRLAWYGEPADVLIALHARRSAESIARFRQAHPQRSLALVLTGTDLYRDLAIDRSAQHSLECASHVVVLQDAALQSLQDAARAKARSIVQSAQAWEAGGETGACDFVAVGHLREEKDPLTLMAAATLLPHDCAIDIVHIGGALDAHLGEQARLTAASFPRYRWLGPLPPAATRDWIANARALVQMSRMEGGANTVIEAVRSGVPVLASRIDGNVGLLGRDYSGYFPVGDAPALAALMLKFIHESDFARLLEAQCAARAPIFAPERERAAVQALVADMLKASQGTMPFAAPEDSP